MSRVAYNTIEVEESIDHDQKEDGAPTSKPVVVARGQERPGDQVARRVAEVLDYELARGSMPA